MRKMLVRVRFVAEVGLGRAFVRAVVARDAPEFYRLQSASTLNGCKETFMWIYFLAIL